MTKLPINNPSICNRQPSPTVFSRLSDSDSVGDRVDLSPGSDGITVGFPTSNTISDTGFIGPLSLSSHVHL